MLEIGREFSQRFEDESAFGKGRVRDRESRFLDDPISEQQNIEVDEARAFLLDALTAHGGFEGEQCVQELARLLRGLNADDAIQEPGLIGEFDGLGLIERRDGAHAGEGAEALDGVAKVAGAIAEVGTEGQVGGSCGHGQFSCRQRRFSDFLAVKKPDEIPMLIAIGQRPSDRLPS
jgi:hypothetical protein